MISSLLKTANDEKRKSIKQMGIETRKDTEPEQKGSTDT